jgi:Ca2+-binding RTX toxin-like protein
LTGGAGNDQFWVAYGSSPNSASFITDFRVGQDVIGFAGLSSVSEFKDLMIVQSQRDARIIAPDQPNLAIAVLEGVQADTLDSSSFAFA